MGGVSTEQLMVTEPDQLVEIEEGWRQLAERRSNAFVTPEWVRAWWQHQGQKTSSLLIAALRHDGELVGVMPLALDKSRRPWVVRFAGASLGDCFHPVAEPAREPAVAATAMSLLHAEGHDRRMLMMEYVEPGRPWLREMQLASPRRLAITQQQQTELPYIPLDGLDWEGYLSQRGRRSRANLRRSLRVLERDHDMKTRLTTEETLEADLDQLFRLHAMRWQGRGTSTLGSPEAQAVLRDFAASAQRRGWLRLQVMEADGHPVAALLAWRIGGSYAYYNSGFDPAWSRHSVGTALMMTAIRTAIEEGASEFDMLLGTEVYKRRFARNGRTVSTVVLTRATSPARLLVAGEARARRHGRRLAELPGLGGVTRRLRRALPTSRQ